MPSAQGAIKSSDRQTLWGYLLPSTDASTNTVPLYLKADINTPFTWSYTNFKDIECSYDNIKQLQGSHTLHGEVRQKTLVLRLENGPVLECYPVVEPFDGFKFTGRGVWTTG